MRTTIAAVAAACLGLPTSAQVTVNVLNRVVQVRSQAGTCSAFTIELDEKQYLVTARHCLKGVNDASGLEIRQGTTWKPVNGPAFFPSNEDVDIAAIGLAKRLTVAFEFQPTTDGIGLGQPVYFLGFPSGLSTKWTPTDTSSLDEVAFIKAGILSAMDSRNPHAVVLYVDGHNNPGFSGGPIVFRPAPNAPFRVAAVVQGFKGEGTPVVKREDLNDPKAPAYQGLYTQANSGIVVGYDITHIVQAIADAKKKK
jgi:hypothetical protein